MTKQEQESKVQYWKAVLNDLAEQPHRQAIAKSELEWLRRKVPAWIQQMKVV